MKKFFAIFTAVVLMPSSQLMAWQGGPFSNNNALPGGDDGVYEAVATLSNGVGLFRFAVRNNGISSEVFGGATGATGGGQTATTATSSNVQFNAGMLGAQSSNVWYYKGISYYGSCYGIANSDAGIISAIGNASSNAGVNFVITPGSVTVPGQVVFLPSVNNAIVSGSSGGNIGFANSSFIAKMQDKGPTVRFSGKGEISFSGNVDTVATIEAINPASIAGGVVAQTPIGGVSGGNTTTATTNTTVSPTTSPGGGTTTATFASTSNETSLSSIVRTGTGGEDSDFSDVGHIRKFLVFGSKVSHTVTP